MSTSGSFWSQIRWRLGGSDAMLAQISDLVQKQIDANADTQEVTEEDILNPIIVSPSKLVVRDTLYKVKERTIAEGTANLIPVDPDLTDMRLWIRNDHGGRFINDHSFMGNKIQLNGTDQSKLIFTTDDDSIEGPGIVNQLIDDQYLRVEDRDKSPNPNVRIKEIAATAEGISVFIRLYVQANDNETEFGKPGVLFSKIDTEQVDFAYGAYLKADGSLFWFVRDTAREYTLTSPPNAVVYSLLGEPDFLETNFEATDFQTSVSGLPPPPDPIPFTDIAFTFQFSNKRMQIYKCDIGGSASVIADSNSNPEASGLTGAWRINEGGDIGNTPDNPSAFTKTVYNTVTTGNNGTITGATWGSETSSTGQYLKFTGGGSNNVSITSYTAIQAPTSFTISLWFYYTGSQPGDFSTLVTKGTSSTANTWWVYVEEPDHHARFTTWNSSAARTDAEHPTILVTNTWNHIVARLTVGGAKVINLNNNKFTGNNTTGSTLDTGSGVPLIFGSRDSTHSPGGIIHDVKIWNRNLSDSEVTALYNAGHPATYLPSWQANPPSVPPPPGPVTNPFVQVYNAAVPASGEQDLVRLHAITAASLTERYNVGQGAQESPPGVPEQGEYSNDPTYDSGSASVKALSTYDQLARTPVVSQYLTLNNTGFCGQRFLTGSDVIGKPILEVQAKFADINVNNAAAVGAITCRIVRNSDHASQAAVTGSVLAESVADNHNGASTSAWTNVTFAFPTNTYVMANNDRVQFEYDQGGVTPTAETLSQYDVGGATIVAGQYFSINKSFIGGQKFLTGNDVIGKPISKILVKMADTNSSNAPATGNVVAKIYSANNTLRATSTTVAATGLADNQGGTSTSNWTVSTFTFSGNAYNMANGDRVQFEYDQGGTGGDTISGFANSGGTITNAAICDLDSFVGHQVDSSASNLHGLVVSKVVVKMARYNGSPTLNMRVAIVNGGTGTELATSNTVSGSVVTTDYPNYTSVTFTFSNPPALNGSHPDYLAFLYNYQGSGSTQMVVGFTGSVHANSHGFAWSSSGGFNHQGNTLEVAMDVYTGSPAKAVGIPRSAASIESNTNTIEAPWSAPTTFTDYANFDLYMDVYTITLGAVRGVGIPYYNTSGEANSNAYTASYSAPTTLSDRSADDLAADVYIDVKTGSPNHQYEQMRLDATDFVAESVNSSAAPIYGKKLTKIRARINRVGSPTGSLFCRLKKGSDGTTITFGLNGTPGASLDVSTLSTASAPATLYTFENDDNGLATGYTTTTGDRIMFELSGGTSNSTNYVQIARTTTASRVANMDLQRSTDGTTWTTVTTDDIIGDMFSGGYTPPPIFPYHTLGYVNSRVVQKVTSTTASVGNIYNQKITQVKPWLKRIGSATGIISVVIRNAADAQVASINTLDASSVDGAAFTQYTFTNVNQTYTMALNDKICVEYSTGDVNNHIQCNTNLLDTYPYGNLETFAGSTYTTQTGHDMAGNMSSGGGASDPLARTRVAETVVTTNSTIKLKKISRVTVYMKRTVSPTGNVTIRIRNSADAIMATLGTVAAGTIDPNTPTAYTITSSPISSYALQVGDKVTVEYNLGDDFNYVEVMTSKTTDLFGGVVNTYLEKFDDINWVPNSAIDLVGTMWEGGDSYTPSQEDVVIPDPKYTKDLTILAGGSPWTWVNHDLETLDFAPGQLWVSAIVPDFRFYRKVLTSTELNNIATNRLDRGTIPLGQVMKLAYSFITET